MRVFILIGCFVVGVRAGRFRAESGVEPPAMLIVSGFSSDQELCLAVEAGATRVDGAAVVLETCATAVAAGDGRELWKLQPGGQLSHAVSRKCAGVANATGQGNVVMMACDGADSTLWAQLPNGQLRVGQQCLSQSGSAPDVTDIAIGAAASATSTFSPAHGAGLAVDGMSSTYWASALDVRGPVVLSADLGTMATLLEAAVSWEFPARAFNVALQQSAGRWVEVFATDANILRVSRIQLGGRSASGVRLTMTALAHSSDAVAGPGAYGIRTLSVMAGGMHAVARDCNEVSRSGDARDKYFPVRVREFDPTALDALRAELPALAEAESGLSAVVSELELQIPKFSACAARSKAASTASLSNESRERAWRVALHHDGGGAGRSVSRLAVDGGSVKNTLAAARRAILKARGMLV